MQSLHAVTDFGLMMPANLLTLGMILGTTASASSGDRPVSPPGFTKWRNRAGTLSVTIVVTGFLATAMWHQVGCVRVERVLNRTYFSPTTPLPGRNVAAQWIAQIEQETQRSPDNEQLQSRLIQLRIHRAQRATYEQVLRGEVAGIKSTDPGIIWDGTTLEAVVVQLFDDSETAPTLEQKVRIRQLMQQEPDLSSAWKTARDALQLNPVQPRTHLRLALLGAASGRPWNDSLRHAMRLSGADPKQSLATGLLAWAAKDIPAMTSQWRQTLQTAPVHAQIILRLSRMRLTDEQVIEQLMPDLWNIPYRLALSLSRSEDIVLKSRLLEAAEKIAARTMGVNDSAKAAIASAQQNYTKAATFLASEVKKSPGDPEKRYRYAIALLKAGREKEAVVQSRMALNLSSGNATYLALFNRARAANEKRQPAAE